MKKAKRFQDGGVADENFTADQIKFLGGADRTDPYILARMRSKFPDAPKAKVETKVDSGELRDETGEKSKIRRNTETGELYSTEASFKPNIKNSPVTEARKPVAVKKETTEVVVEKEEPKKTTDNAYLNRSRAVTDGVKKTAGEFTKLRNYNPLAKLGDVAEGISSRISKFTKETPAEQAEKFRSRSMTAGKGMKAGGMVSSASKRADGCAIRGKTRA